MNNSSQPKCFSFAFIVVLLFFLSTIIIGCGGGGGSGDGDSDDAAVSGIGKAGGEVVDDSGAKVVVPAGALSDTYDITISSYTDNDALPAGWAPIPEMRGAVDLQPDGLTFLKPVTITVPLASAMDPGSKFPLLYWNENLQIWEQTTFTATVASDGMSFSADITHFSGFGGGAVQNLLSGGTAAAFMADFSQWFRNNINDIGDKAEKNNECHEVVGIDFDLEYEINGEKGEDFLRVGETSSDAGSPMIMVDFTYDVSNGHGFSGYIRITTILYYQCARPDLSISASRSMLTEGEDATVELVINCDGTSLTGKSVTFAIQSGPGEINPGNTTTNSGGKATSTFTAGDDDAVVSAVHIACELDEAYTMTKTVPLSVVSPDYNLSIFFEQTTSVEDIYDYYSYSGAVPISITGDNGDGTASVAGSATMEVSGNGTTDECTTVTEGSVTFTFSGTLASDDNGGQTLDLTQSPNFTTTKTASCPDGVIVNDFLTGGEPSQFQIPAEDGHTIEKTFSGPITSYIRYVLHVPE